MTVSTTTTEPASDKSIAFRIRNLFGKTSSYKYLSCKIIYFLLYAPLGCVLPFYTLYLKQESGMPPWYIGILTSLMPFTSFIFTPLWTMLSDKFNIHSTLLLLVSIVSSGALMLLPLAGSNQYVVFIIMFVYSITFSPLCSLVDFLVLRTLGEDDRQLYGQQRFTGAIGWGITAFLTGILVNHFNDLNIIFYHFAFWMCTFVVAAFFTFHKPSVKSWHWLWFIKIDQVDKDVESAHMEDRKEDKVEMKIMVPSDKIIEVPVELDIDGVQSTLLQDSMNMTNEDLYDEDLDGASVKSERPEKDVSAFKLILGNSQMIIFLVAATITGMAATIISNYLFLFLSDDLHASETLLGSTMPCNVVMELPFFFFGKQLLTKMGVKWMIIFGNLAFILRVLAYNLFLLNISPWYVLPIELLQGVGFACLWTAGVEFASQYAPPGHEATYQGVFAGMYGGLGSGVGTILGGMVYQHFGAMILWRAVASSMAVSLILVSLLKIKK
eukprot:gene12475-14636_t